MDPLKEVKDLRLKVSIGVYAAITASLPFYYFVMHHSAEQLISGYIIGWIISVTAITLAFGQMFRMRKRSAYPSLLLVRAGAAENKRAAAREALDTLSTLMPVREAFVALATEHGSLEIIAAADIDEDRAAREMEEHRQHIFQAMTDMITVVVPDRTKQDESCVHVPIVALNRATGVLSITGRVKGELADAQLMTGIGTALGHSLENLRQREEIQEKEQRLRAVVIGAPVALFSLDSEGRYTLLEGSVLESVTDDPSQYIGRAVREVYPDRPDIVAEMERALAGEEVSVTAEVNGVLLESRMTPVKDARGAVTGVIGVSWDVTERSKAEARVEASERRFRSLVEKSGDGIAIVDLEGKFSYAGPSTVRVLGYAPDEPIGVSGFSLIHPDDRPACAEKMKEVVAEPGACVALEFRIRHKNGSYRWIEATGTNLVHEPDIGGIVVNYRDITERKDAQQALNESERVLSTLMRNLPGAAYRCLNDPNWTNEFMSEGIRELVGYGPEEFIGPAARMYADLIHPDDRDMVWEAVQDAVQKGEPFRMTYRLIAADGKEKWAWEQGQGVFSEDGELQALEGFIADITERVRAEQALRESEELYRSLVETSPDIVLLTTPAGEILKANRLAAQLFGYDEAEEIIGLSALDFVASDERERVSQEIRQKSGTDIIRNIQYHTVTRRGQRVPVELSVSRIRDSGGNTKALITVARDISDRVRAERALRESEQRFRAVFHNSAIGIAVVALDGRPLETNSAFQEMLGYSAEELNQLSYIDVTHPDDVEAEIVMFGEMSSGKLDNFQIEKRYLSKDGRVVWGRLTASVVKSAAGDVLFGVAMVEDITERKHAEEALRQSEERYRDLVENTNEVIYTQDTNGVITYMSPAVEQVAGYAPEELVGSVSMDFIHPDDLPELAESFRRSLEGHQEPSEYRVRVKSGEYRWVRSSSRPVYANGQMTGLHGVLVDITERRLAEEALRESEERYRELFENASDIIFTLDLQGRFISANRAAERVTGYSRDQSLTLNELLAPDQQEPAAEMVRSMYQNAGPQTYELEIIARNGRRIPIEVSPRLVYEKGRPVAIQGIARDITERKEAEETIRMLAYHDALTGLPNRALFEDRLNVALAQATRADSMLAVMFLDVDRFKMVNDTIGHNGGDKLLQSVATELRHVIRDGDTVARVGGDEFTLLLPNLNGTEDAIAVAERILETMKRPRILGGQEFRVTTSIGITIYPGDGRDGESLLRNADTAMYRAKEYGRDNYQMYTSAMNASLLDRLAMENDLRHAIEREEFTMAYQPIVDVHTGKMIAAEALLRWNHPERGPVPPDEFIPFAEETGLVLMLGDWVLRTVCRQNKAWQDEGYEPIPVAVNMAGRQLQQDDLVEWIARTLEETGLDPQYLQIEITEGAVMKNVEHIVAMLSRLRKMGVGIAVDDFGTGYSSLSYLKRFPIDAVKIDRSFVRDVATDPNDAAIVTTIIAMAGNLNLGVVAEGVETNEQLEFLKAHACREYQGYLFSRPEPVDVFEKLLTRAAPRSRKPRRAARAR